MRNKWIEIVSIDEPINREGDGYLCLADILPSDENIEHTIELRDLLSRLPAEIVQLGQKRVDGYPLTATERKRLERFRRLHRNGGDGNKF